MSCVLAMPETMTAAAAVGITHLFSRHAQDYQALAVKAAAFQNRFVQHLTASAGSFAGAEAANVAALRPLAATAESIGDMFNDARNALGAFFRGIWNAIVSFFSLVLTYISHFLLGLLAIALLFLLFPPTITFSSSWPFINIS